MFVVYATKKLLDRIREQPVATDESTTALGSWYATVLFWRPQVALFVSESTFFPVLLPLAPAATVIDRFAESLGDTLGAHAIDQSFINDELDEMTEHRVAKTASRSVVGIMNEFVRLASFAPPPKGPADLIQLSWWLAATPCSPLYGRHGSPDRELRTFVAERTG